jgi:hypothetical protein
MEEQPKTNTLAIVGLVLSLLPFVGIGAIWGSIGGIICGYLAKKQIEESAGAEGGEGLAKAALWVGVGGLVLYVLIICCVLTFTLILPAIGIATSNYY